MKKHSEWNTLVHILQFGGLERHSYQQLSKWLDEIIKAFDRNIAS
jgi:hypothetical protein